MTALPDWFHELAREVNNWGRWGDDDGIGTVNLITPEVVRRGAASVRTGRAFSLAIPLSEREGIQMGYSPGRVNPTRSMVQHNTPLAGDPDGVCANDDLVVMGLQAGTHWDGLGHVTYGGRAWNGFGAESITWAGATRCGVHLIRTLVSRGVLLDVARAKGVDRLEGAYAITADDLEAAEELAGVRVEPGDVVLVRTGQMGYLRSKPRDRAAYAAPAPGVGVGSVRWFRSRDVAAVATDTMPFEPIPGEHDDEVFLPVHLLHIVEMGLTQGQNFQLEDLAADCAADGRYTFLLEASPQPFTYATGSPVNPVAVK